MAARIALEYLISTLRQGDYPVRPRPYVWVFYQLQRLQAGPVSCLGLIAAIPTAPGQFILDAVVGATTETGGYQI
jgi:hypothetical protein